jgi:hypothetical protein
MPAHSGLTGASLHESKGAAAATLGQVAVADGAGAAVFGTLVNGSLAAGMIVQVKYATPYTTYAAVGQIPFDNSIPQITEGSAVTSVSITPKSATNKLIIFANALLGSSSAEGVTLALFQDATANALAAAAAAFDGANNIEIDNVILLHVMDAGTTSATTFATRAGDDGSAGFINGNATSRKFGGVSSANLIVVEVKV